MDDREGLAARRSLGGTNVMTPERWGQIKRLYDNAQALQPAERAALP
jgi:hypothetical protein